MDKKIIKYFLGFIALGFGLWKIYLLKKLLIWFFIAVLISLIIRPMIQLLEKKCRLPKMLSIGITMLFLSFIFIGIVGLVAPLVLNLGNQLSSIDAAYLNTQIINVWSEGSQFFEINGFDIVAQIQQIDFAKYLKEIPLLILEIFSGAGNFIIGGFCVGFISFFLAKERGLLHRLFFAFVPESKEEKWKISIEKIKELLSRYLIGIVFQISILFVFYTVLLLFIGVKNAFSIGSICALLNLIPFAGPVIGYVLMSCLTVVNFLYLDFQSIILPKIYIITVGYALAQLIDNFLVQPLVFSKSVRSHPLEIFLVITAAGIGFGVFAMVLSVPFYTALKVVIKTFFSEHRVVKNLFDHPS